jgi:Rrf2 family protein
MHITAKINYACIAVMELAAHHGSDRPVSIREISQKHGIPAQFLMQILLQLKRAGLINSTRGPSGGYSLAVLPENISLAEVIAATDGSSESNSHVNDSETTRALSRAWKRINTIEQELLSEISFADLLEDAQKQDQMMYYI